MQIIKTFFLSFFFCSSFVWAEKDLSVVPYSKLDSLGSGLYSYQYGVDRTLVLIGDDAVLVTDPLNEPASKNLHKLITKKTDKPVSAVIYSNSFFNRVAGGQVFKEKGATIVSHQQCQKNLELTPNSKISPIDKVYKDRKVINAGGSSFTLIYLGESYGNCLSVVIAKPANVMWVVGLINPDKALIPNDPTLANYFLYNLLPVYNRLNDIALAENIKWIAGSHQINDNALLSPISLIDEQRKFWQLMFDSVKRDYDKGVSARAMGKRLDLSQFENFDNYNKEKLQIMTRRVYSLYRIGR